MAKNISIKVKAQDEASGTLNKVSGRINSLSKDIKSSTAPLTNFGKSLKGLASSVPGIGLVAAAIAGVTKAVTDSVKKMSEWETAWAQVEATTKRINFASTINKQLQESGRSLMLFTEELSASIRNVISSGDLAASTSSMVFDKTADQIKQVLTVATDLSAALGTDLNTAVSQLNNTFSGTAGQLAKLFPELKQLSKEALEAGDAIEIIGNKVKGAAKEMADSVQGSILRGKNLSNDLKEELGYYVKDFFTPLRNEISDIKKRWVEALASRRTYQEALKAHQSGRAGVEDYDVLITRLEQDRAKEAANKQMREAAGFGTGEAETEILRLTQQINEYKKLQNNIRSYLNSQKSAETGKAPAAAQTSATATASAEQAEQVKTLTKEQIKAQAELNQKMYEASVAEQNRQKDIEVESALRQSAFQKWKDAADSIAQFKEDLKNSITSSTGEIGKLFESYEEGGWKAVLLQVLSMALSKMSEMSGIINAIFNTVSTVLGEILPSFIKIAEPVLNPLLSVIQSISGIVSSVFDLLKPFIDIVTPILEIIGGVVYWMKTFLTSILDYIKYGFVELVNWVIRMYNYLVPKRKEVSEWSHDKSISQINDTFLSLWNGTFIDDYKAMLERNYGLSGASTGISGTATYNAARDIYVTINFNDSFVYTDKSTLAVELAREIRRAEKMNLV